MVDISLVLKKFLMKDQQNWADVLALSYILISALRS